MTTVITVRRYFALQHTRHVLIDRSWESNNPSLFAHPTHTPPPAPCYPVLCKLDGAVSGFAEDSRGLRTTKTASPQLTYVVPAAPRASRRQWDSSTDLPTRMLCLITPTIVSFSSSSSALPRHWSPHHGKSLAQEPFALKETRPSTVTDLGATPTREPPPFPRRSKPTLRTAPRRGGCVVHFF